MSIEFRPASSFTDQHGLFVALVGGTNSGKSFSALRLARGIAGPTGKIAAACTEGGRLLHLKDHFDFDLVRMDPPHRPDRYAEVARVAEDRGYAALLIDSFSSEWRGVGGVLDWMDGELDAMVERQRANAEQKKWAFDEARARNSNKMAASIRPKMAHKLMVNSFLDRRIPIIFSIRGELTLDPDTKKEKFKAQCGPGFLFEVTVSFRLASDRKGFIDLSDPASFKMEGAHRDIFRDGEQLSEEHGAALIRWARGGDVGGRPSQQQPSTVSVIGVGEFPRSKRGLSDALDAIKDAGPSAVLSNLEFLDMVAERVPDFSERVADIRAMAMGTANDDDFPGTMPNRAGA